MSLPVEEFQTLLVGPEEVQYFHYLMVHRVWPGFVSPLAETQPWFAEQGKHSGGTENLVPV